MCITIAKKVYYKPSVLFTLFWHSFFLQVPTFLLSKFGSHHKITYLKNNFSTQNYKLQPNNERNTPATSSYFVPYSDKFLKLPKLYVFVLDINSHLLLLQQLLCAAKMIYNFFSVNRNSLGIIGQLKIIHIQKFNIHSYPATKKNTASTQEDPNNL